MEITRVEVFEVKVPWVERLREHMGKAGMPPEGAHRFVYKIYTDDGLIGYADGPDARGLIPKIVGHSPFEFMLDDSLWPLQVGLYDLMGKALGLPVCKLFGPVYREIVNVAYWSHCFPPEVLADEARRAAEAGFKVHKIKIRPARDPVEQVKAIYEAVPEMQVIADANCTLWLVSKAVKVAKALERYNVFCMESPLPQQDIEGYRELKGKTVIPLAMHMGWGSGSEWTPNPMTAIERRMVDYFVVEEHGARAMLKSGILAETAVGKASASGGYMVEGMPLWIEVVGLGPMEAFGIHLAAAMKTAILPSITHVFSQHLYEDDLIIEEFKFKEGEVEVPKGPGLGITVDEEALEKYRVK
ncbi:mandelate racemase/muconate lactonizing enzyme family protein [Candidatus Bathyarchaeota archaeon]|nr:mandelate racemase/muconate lactonizing enzyme family protein [Candidatus Bathyarchaeota archaeon]